MRTSEYGTGMQRPLLLALLTIALAAIAVPGWLISHPPAAPTPSAPVAAADPEDYPSPVPFHGALLLKARAGQATPDATQYAALKRMADRSCRCARSQRGRAYGECWAEFDANAGTFASYRESTTMCMTTITKACFDGHDCLVKDYDGQCSEREAAAVEAVYDRARRQGGSEAERNAAFTQAKREVERLTKRWDAGAQVAAAPPVQGCGG